MFIFCRKLHETEKKECIPVGYPLHVTIRGGRVSLTETSITETPMDRDPLDRDPCCGQTNITFANYATEGIARKVDVDVHLSQHPAGR